MRAVHDMQGGNQSVNMGVQQVLDQRRGAEMLEKWLYTEHKQGLLDLQQLGSLAAPLVLLQVAQQLCGPQGITRHTLRDGVGVGPVAVFTEYLQVARRLLEHRYLGMAEKGDPPAQVFGSLLHHVPQAFSSAKYNGTLAKNLS